MIYRLRRFLRNVRLWFDILKSDEQWDYVFMEKVILHKLKLMKDFYDSGQNHTVADDTVKELNITINALKRVIEDDYIRFPEGKKPEIKTVNMDGELFLHRVEISYHDDFGEEKVDEVYEKASKERSEDRETVYRMLRDKSPNWWD